MPASPSAVGGDEPQRHGVEFDPNAEVLARVVITVAERSTPAELSEWAENLWLCTAERALAMEPEELASRIFLLILELESRNADLVRIPSREDLLLQLYPAPQGLPPGDGIVSRQTECAEVDGIVFQKPLSSLELRFLDTLHKRLHLDGDDPFGWDPDEEAEITEEARAEVLASARPGEDAEYHLIGARYVGSAMGDVIHPGPTACFFALEDAGGPWDLRSEPWGREPRKWIDLRRLRQVQERPSRFNSKELEGLGLLNPVARARARIVSRRIGTGMSLAADRIEQASGDGDLDDVLGFPLGEAEWDREALVGGLIPVFAKMRAEGFSSKEALVEMSELLCTSWTDNPTFRAGFEAVARAFNYPRDLPVFALPTSTAYRDEELSLRDVSTVESWTDDLQLRWIIYFTLRRVKGTMDDLRRVRFPSRWIFESRAKADDALPVGSRDRFSQVKPILERHVWRTLIGHSSGTHSTVYWVLYEFDTQTGKVSQEEMAARWGSPNTRS